MKKLKPTCIILGPLTALAGLSSRARTQYYNYVIGIVLVASSVLSATSSRAQISIDILGIYQTETLCKNNPSLNHDMPGFCQGQHYSGYFNNVTPTAGQRIRSNRADVQHSSEDLARQGFRLLQQGKFQAASNTFDSMIALNHNNARAYTFRGLARTKVRDYQGALEDANQAIRLDSNLAYGYGVRSIARMGLKDYQGALEDADQAIRCNPKAAWAYKLRRSVQSYLGN